MSSLAHVGKALRHKNPPLMYVILQTIFTKCYITRLFLVSPVPRDLELQPPLSTGAWSQEITTAPRAVRSLSRNRPLL